MVVWDFVEDSWGILCGGKADTEERSTSETKIIKNLMKKSGCFMASKLTYWLNDYLCVYIDFNGEDLYYILSKKSMPFKCMTLHTCILILFSF